MVSPCCLVVKCLTWVCTQVWGCSAVGRLTVFLIHGSKLFLGPDDSVSCHRLCMGFGFLAVLFMVHLQDLHILKHARSRMHCCNKPLSGFRILVARPRFLCGDFNHDLSHLPIVEVIKNAGFVDLQDLNLSRNGLLPTATCRRKTRRDYCFASPELAPLFRSSIVLDVEWSDHGVLIGTFDCQEADKWRYPWPIPDSIDWSKLVPRYGLVQKDNV